MNKKLFLVSIIPLLFAAISGCSEKHNYELVVLDDAEQRTYIVGDDFNQEGLKVGFKCTDCDKVLEKTFELENNSALEANQESITISASLNGQNYSLDYEIFVKEKYHIACVGDSLTAGHYWANESYPTKLSGIINERYQVENCGVNGISITGYGGSWDDPNKQYIKQDVYQQSLNFKPDIFAIMLGTNDATGWEKAEPTFEEEYHELLDSYIEKFPHAKFIMMVSPPCISPNQFNIPNDKINDYVNPIQRDLAEEYGFELLDLREEFEAEPDYQNKYLRPNDGVHFTAAAAEFVAQRVWDIAKDLKF